MASEVVNKLVVRFDDTEVVEEFLEMIKGNDPSRDEVIDFNIIVPMPKELEDTISGSMQWKSLYYYTNQTNQRDAIPEMESLLYSSMSEWIEDDEPDKLAEYMAVGELYFNNYMKYGATDWYMWRNKYWGTKQNAYNSYIVKESKNSVAIYFTTAWDGVPYLMEILISLFPELEFTYKFADENIACNCGEGQSNSEGEFIFNIVEDNSIEALRLYCECWGREPKDFTDDLDSDEDEE